MLLLAGAVPILLWSCQRSLCVGPLPQAAAFRKLAWIGSSSSPVIQGAPPPAPGAVRQHLTVLPRGYTTLPLLLVGEHKYHLGQWELNLLMYAWETSHLTSLPSGRLGGVG